MAVDIKEIDISRWRSRDSEDVSPFAARQIRNMNRKQVILFGCLRTFYIDSQIYHGWLAQARLDNLGRTVSQATKKIRRG